MKRIAPILALIALLAAYLRMAEWPVSGTYCCPNGGKK